MDVREKPSSKKRLIDANAGNTAHGMRKKVLTMPDCKYCQDEICVNADCPMCCDFCPVVDYPGVCRFEEREERNEQS